MYAKVVDRLLDYPPPQDSLLLAACCPSLQAAIGRFCWKSRPWFPRQKSTRLRLKSSLLA